MKTSKAQQIDDCYSTNLPSNPEKAEAYLFKRKSRKITEPSAVLYRTIVMWDSSRSKPQPKPQP